ncbi:thioredoxin family protein [Paenibacillus protaetiae]|uniref:Thioredoxin family protein n=1 Tax=Paenibacillus protaetiae TaxID=2509456 RepID=A0A4P6F1Z1_9BACL|nr:thioredoxin family protein [Paenibacillus protaetiae]QAY68159.1 thioredoxin family protein [Paenibacillus protaetiae]
MSIQLADKIGTGITPAQFIEGMTKNKEAFTGWYDKFEWPSAEDRSFFESLSGKHSLRCFILMADWCGDAVRNIPVVLHALEAAQIPVEVLIMEQHLDTMDQFLTFGGRSIPVVIFTDEQGQVLGKWGPRPSYVQEAMVQFKQNNPDRNAADYETNLAETRKEIMRRYGEGAAYHPLIISELRELIGSF